MEIAGYIFEQALQVAKYAAIGGVAMFIGNHLSGQWRDPEVPRIVNWIAVVVFGFVVWHAPEIAAAFASGSGTE